MLQHHPGVETNGIKRKEFAMVSGIATPGFRPLDSCMTLLHKYGRQEEIASAPGRTP